MNREELNKIFIAAFRKYKDMEYPYLMLKRAHREELLCLLLKSGVLLSFFISSQYAIFSLYTDPKGTMSWMEGNLLKTAFLTGFLFINFDLFIWALREGFGGNIERLKVLKLDKKELDPLYKCAKRKYKALHAEVNKKSKEEVK